MTLYPTFPSLEVLTAGLSSVLFGDSAAPATVTVIDRQPLNTTQSHPSEIVRCRTADGRELQLLCKCADGAPDSHMGYGHRRGGAYEALIYSRLLVPLEVQVPHWYGTYCDSTGTTWLVMGYLDGGVRLSRAGPGRWKPSLVMAAEWIARFQNAWDAAADRRVLSSLIVYDGDYYAGWARRALRLAESAAGAGPWLEQVVDQYCTSIVPRLLARPTVVHGEFYPANMLLWQGRVHVLDWESAAVGAGEIDLACLLEGLKPATADDAISAYHRERNPPQSAQDVTVALNAALLYMQFRWLGDPREWRIDDDLQRRFALLREAAGRLGIL